MEINKNRLMTTMKNFINLKNDLLWKYVIFNTFWHAVALYGVFSFPYLKSKMTFLWFLVTFILFAFGITGGAHRFWTHRSYKAKWPLRVILAFCYYGSGMFKLFDWVRIHRVHHKYSDTDADPHNVKRGFFFSHMGWVMLKKHPEFLKKLREVDMSDIQADPIVRFGDKHFIVLILSICFILPTIVPIYFWNESWYWAIMSQVFMRYVLLVNVTASVNSVAHLWGSKPYDRNIHPVESKVVAALALGEGWHNYHHTFPWDYKAGELLNNNLNLTTFVINQFAKIGWAYDLKQPTDDLIKLYCERRGDGSHPTHRVS